MANTDKCLLRKIILDFICFGIVATSKLLFSLYGKPYVRGFFCNDESISYPYKSSTIPRQIFYSIGLGCPLLIIFFTEYFILKYSYEHNPKIIAGYNFSPWLWECYKVMGVFLFGAACSQLTTDTSKYVLGTLRPHFMDVCRPDINCSLPENQHRYIELYTCLGTNEKGLKKMRLSFMSGHSSFAAYTMIFLCMYVHARWTWRGSRLIRHVMQFAAFTFAWYSALSRISDYKHHWSDVTAGALQGTLMAVLIVLFVSDLFPKKLRKSTDTRIVLPNDVSKTLLELT